MGEHTSARAVLMVRPRLFWANEETAGSNAFQRGATEPREALLERARDEFDAFAAALRGAGIRVIALEQGERVESPDALFPNNWVSFHADGTVVLYPMFAPSRRTERDGGVLDALTADHGVAILRTIDLTGHEAEGRFLEGTGSLVLDHPAKLAFASRSVRTDEGLVREWCKAMGFDPVVFDAVDRNGDAVYHTNVVMSVGERVAVVCEEAIAVADRERVLGALRREGRALVTITMSQLESFAGNMLELAGADGPVMAMSASALVSLMTGQRRAIEERCRIVSADLATIEHCGGGSSRCMLAEVFADAD